MFLALGLTSFVGFVQHTLVWRVSQSSLSLGFLSEPLNIEQLTGVLFLFLAIFILIIQVATYRSENFLDRVVKWTPLMLFFSPVIYCFTEGYFSLFCVLIFVAIPLAVLPSLYMKMAMKEMSTEEPRKRDLRTTPGQVSAYFIIAHSMGYALGGGLASLSLFQGVDLFRLAGLFLGLVLIFASFRFLGVYDQLKSIEVRHV